jgi:hypothetical protein
VFASIQGGARRAFPRKGHRDVAQEDGVQLRKVAPPVDSDSMLRARPI